MNNYENTGDLFSPLARQIAVIMLAVLTVLFAVMTLKTFREFQTVGQGVDPSPTISVSGEGEAFARPDIATLFVTTSAEGQDVAGAQEEAAGKNNAIVEFLKDKDIDDEDMKTSSYRINPRYEWRRAGLCDGIPCPPQGKRILVGYEVSQTLEVKVRDLSAIGKILSGVGERGATNVSGPQFAVEDRAELQGEAREAAIRQVKEKAEELADSLGVSLVRIVNFSESGSTPGPRVFGLGDTVATESVVVPEVPTGETRITSNITITYEIQ